MEAAAARMDRGQNPVRYNLRRQVHPLMNETDLAHKTPDSPDRSRLNVNGSGISLGRPIGATGVRMMAVIFQRV